MKITKSRLVEIIKEEAASYDDTHSVKEGILDLFKPKSAATAAKGEPGHVDLIAKAIRQSHGESMKAIERMTDKFNKRIAAIEKELEIRAPVEPAGPADDTEIDPRYRKND